MPRYAACCDTHRRFNRVTIGLAMAATMPMLASAQAPTTAEPVWQAGGLIQVTGSFKSIQEIPLALPLTLDVAQGHTVELAGTISAPWGMPNALTKNGLGRLVLSGTNNTLFSTTMVRQGTLHVAGSMPAGPSTLAEIALQSGATLSYASDANIGNKLIDYGVTGGESVSPVMLRVDEGTASQVGLMMGRTPLDKVGKGTLNIVGGSVFPDSRMNVRGGGVHMQGPFAGDIKIHTGAWLSGSGWAGTLHVDSGATLRPTGELTVVRELIFAPGSTLVVRTWANGQHDSVHSETGTARLGGHVQVMPQGASDEWAQAIDYPIIKAGGGLGDTSFSSVASAVPYLRPTLSYTPEQVTLRLAPHDVTTPPSPVTPDTPAPTPSTPPSPAPDPDQPVTSNKTPTNTRPPRPASLIAVVPSPVAIPSGWAGTARTTLIDDTRFIREAVYQTARRQPDGFWSHAIHASNERRTDNAHARASARDYQGVLLGHSFQVNPLWSASGYVGASQTRLREHANSTHPTMDAARSDVSSAHMGLHAQRQSPWGSLVVGVAHSQHRLKHQRTAYTHWQDGTFLFGHPSGARQRAQTTQIFAEGAITLWESVTQATRLEPFVNTAWIQHRDRGYAESGGPLSMRIDGQTQHTVLTTVGLAGRHVLDAPQGQATMHGRVGWRYTRGDTQLPVSQHYRDDPLKTGLQAFGLPLQRHAWELQLGVRAALNKTASVGIHYSGLYASGLQDHGAQLGLTIAW